MIKKKSSMRLVFPTSFEGHFKKMKSLEANADGVYKKIHCTLTAFIGV